MVKNSVLLDVSATVELLDSLSHPTGIILGACLAVAGRNVPIATKVS